MKKILLLMLFLTNFQGVWAQSYPVFEYETDQCFEYFLQEKNLSWENLENRFIEIITDANLTQSEANTMVQYQTFVANMAQGKSVTPSIKAKYLINDLKAQNINFSSADKYEPASVCFRNFHEKHQKTISQHDNSRYEAVYKIIEGFSDAENLDAKAVAQNLKATFTNEDYKNPLYRKIIFFSVFVPALYQAYTPTLENEEEQKTEEIESSTDEPEQIFMIVETMPEFPGGQLALMQFIAQNVKYPAEAREGNIQGIVYLRFIIKKDGSVDNVSVARSVHPLLDDAAISVIKQLPKWKPGIIRGENVAVWYTIPIKFALK